jgi:hypothetical protein
MATTTPRPLVGTGHNPWADKEVGVCDESGCTAPQRRLLRHSGGAYISDFCWEHSCLCLVCHGAIDDGEDLCAYHSEVLGARYEQDLSEEVRTAILAGTHPLTDPAVAEAQRLIRGVVPKRGLSR